MTGKIPITQKIELRSSTDQWKMVEHKLINELSCSGLIEIHKNTKVRINIVINSVRSPHSHHFESVTEVTGDSKNSMINKGLERITDYFQDLCNKKTWILIGYIRGSNLVPIMIVYYESFDISIYTIKFKKESYLDFLPEGVSPSE